MSGAKGCMKVIVTAWVTLALSCAPKGPPPRVAEVPIDTAPPSGTLFPAGGEAIPPGEVPVNSGAAAALAAGGSTGPTPLSPDPATSATPAPSGSIPLPTLGSSHSGKPGKGQRLTAADCNKLMDKYIGLVAVSQGVAADQVKNVLPMMKQTVQNDPNYAAAQTSCVEQNSKKQYACAMKSTSVDGWTACLQ